MLSSVEELTYEAKSESSRERDRFSVELIQMAKELVIFCRDTIIVHGKAMSHRATFAPQIIRNIKAPTTRSEDRIIEMEEFLATSSARFGSSVNDVKHATRLTIEAVRGLMTKLNMAPGLVTEASLETSWLKVKQAVTLLIDNVDKWIISEQEKELAESSSSPSTSPSASSSPLSSTSSGSLASAPPSVGSVNRLLADVRSSADALMSVPGNQSESDDEVDNSANEMFSEASKRCALVLNDLVIAAKRLNLTTDASALREANFLFLAGAKLYYHTQTEGSQKDLQKQREQLDAVLQRISDSVSNSASSVTSSSSSTKLSLSPRTMSAALPPKIKTRQQELKDLVIQRSRADSIHLASMFVNLPLASRVQEGLTRVRACQKLIRLRIKLRKWRTLVEEYSKSSSSSTSRKRYKCFWEITTSEKTYLAALKTALEVWMPPLRKGAVKGVGDTEVDKLFSNMGTLIESSRNLISEISRRSAQNPVTQSIGDIFLKLGPWLRLYGPYVNNFDSATALLKQLQKKSGWSAYVSQCVKEAPAKTELGSYLIMPVQRIPRYELLLKTLIGYTPEDHVDYQHLTQALAMIKDINDKIDTMQIGGGSSQSGPLPQAAPPVLPPAPISARGSGLSSARLSKEASLAAAQAAVAAVAFNASVKEKESSPSAKTIPKETAALGSRSNLVPKRDSIPTFSGSPIVVSPTSTPPPPLTSPGKSGSGLSRPMSLPLALPPAPIGSSSTAPISPISPTPGRVASSVGLSNGPKFPAQPPPVRPQSAVSGNGSPVGSLPPLTASLDGSGPPAGIPLPSRPPPLPPSIRSGLTNSYERSSGGSNSPASHSPLSSGNNSPARTETPPKLPPVPPSPLSSAAPLSPLHSLKALAAPPPVMTSPLTQARSRAVLAQSAPVVASSAVVDETPPQSSAQMKPGTIMCLLPPHKVAREARVQIKVDKLVIMIKRNLVSKEAIFDFEQEIVFQEVVVQETVPNLGEFGFGFGLVNEKGQCTFYCRNAIEKESYLNRINGVIKRFQLKLMLEEMGHTMPPNHPQSRQRSGLHNMHM